MILGQWSVEETCDSCKSSFGGSISPTPVLPLNADGCSHLGRGLRRLLADKPRRRLTPRCRAPQLPRIHAVHETASDFFRQSAHAEKQQASEAATLLDIIWPSCLKALWDLQENRPEWYAALVSHLVIWKFLTWPHLSTQLLRSLTR